MQRLCDTICYSLAHTLQYISIRYEILCHGPGKPVSFSLVYYLELYSFDMDVQRQFQMICADREYINETQNLLGIIYYCEKHAYLAAVQHMCV